MTKKNIEVEISRIEFGSSLAETIGLLQQHLATAPAAGFTAMWLKEETYGYPYDPTEYHGVFLKGLRLETDEEYTTRSFAESARNAKVEAAERAQFEMLSKKFKEHKQ